MQTKTAALGLVSAVLLAGSFGAWRLPGAGEQKSDPPTPPIVTSSTGELGRLLSEHKPVRFEESGASGTTAAAPKQ